MKTDELYAVEERARGFSHRFRITFADLTAAATTQTISLTTGIIAGDIVDSVSFYLKTPFSGGAATSLTMQVGYDLAVGTDDPDGFIAAAELNAAGTEILAATSTGAGVATATGFAFVEGASLTALFTATGANVNTHTAGEVWIYLDWIRLSKL